MTCSPFFNKKGHLTRIMATATSLMLMALALFLSTTSVAQAQGVVCAGGTCAFQFSGGGNAQAAWQGSTSGPVGTRGYSEGRTTDRSSIRFDANITASPPGVPCELNCTTSGGQIKVKNEATSEGWSVVTSGSLLNQPLPAGASAHNTVGAQSASNVASSAFGLVTWEKPAPVAAAAANKSSGKGKK